MVVAERCRETRREGRVAGEAVREFLGTTPPSGGISGGGSKKGDVQRTLRSMRLAIGGWRHGERKNWPMARERERDTHIIILMRVRGNSREPDELSESTWGIQKGEN